jgi:ABC-type Fe3+ transport system substrate-binding protein
MRQDFAGLGFNTAAVAPQDAPHTYTDLLDPKWKGKLALAARPSSLTLYLTLRPNFDADYRQWRWLADEAFKRRP